MLWIDYIILGVVSGALGLGSIHVLYRLLLERKKEAALQRQPVPVRATYPK